MSLSIITINYNNASGLRKTIESVKAQTSRDFEHIIIDGGSTDGSVEVIQSFTDIPRVLHPQADNQSSSITYWISEPDKGIHQGMNKRI
jgi:glycosyltransferase involved in cell wall biosynthesis